jgi:iron complex outermembrane receptor protein
MRNLTNISLSLLTLVTAGLTGCAQVPSDQKFSASEPSLPAACDQPVQERSYVATCVSTTSRQPDTPIRDIPSSTQVITRPLIDDQKALTVGDALRNVSGVQGR